MRYEFINEFDVNTSADDVWEIYSSPNFPALTVKLLPNILKSEDILEGDGGSVRTILRHSSLPMCREKIVTVDHEKRLKEIQTIEGGYLEMGCTFSMLSFEILVKERNSCIIKTVTKYEINDDLATTISGHLHTYLNGCVTIAQGVSKLIAAKNAGAAK
ncbi:hypothetical protein MKX01_012919 [Papaver californicum]|nr:hypothetical protein MKX01_012919 [Papaver californicum]